MTDEPTAGVDRPLTRAERRALRLAGTDAPAASVAEVDVDDDLQADDVDVDPASSVSDGSASANDAGGRRTAARARRRARAERRRFWLVTMPIIVVLLAALVGVGIVLRQRDDGSGGNDGGATIPALQRTTALVGHTTIDGTADVLVLLGRTGSDGSVLLMPGATQVEVPSLGIQTLAQVSSLGTNELLTTTVENLTGIRTGAPILGGDAQVAAAIAPAAPLAVNLPHDVTPKGETRPETTAGSHRVSADEALRLLTVREEGSEVDHLVTVQAVLSAWFAKLREPKIAEATRRAAPELAPPLIEVANTGTASFDTLPVDSIGTSGDERLRVRSTAMPSLSERMFPDARLSIEGSRPRVEILNGVGTVGLAQAVASRIVPVGADVRLTGNWPGFGVTATQVVYYRDRDRHAAQVLLDAVGVGSLRKARRAVGITDVTIVVGSDFPPKAAAS